jgi:single-stranded-DNA-specific exonuclease
VIVKHGLEGLSSARNHGLRAILEVSGITGKPSSRQIAFQVAPRINAAGRMDTAEAAIELFLTPDADRARQLAQQLNEQNAERQAVEAEIREKCEQEPVDPAQSALVYFDEEWHRGVLGIVASRLVERFTRPVFVLGLNSEDGMAQGSGRSIPGFHLLDALDSMRELFARYGGHSYAAGVTLEASRVPEFRSRLEEYASARLRPEDFVRQLRVDALVDPDDLDNRSASGLFSLAPFGYGNPAPVFAALDVEIAGPPVPLGERGCRLSVRRNGRLLPLKAWDFGARASEFEAGAKVDVAFSVEEDAYSAARGYSPWCAVLKDIRPAALAAQA